MTQTWLFDFDNTAFLTFTPPEGGIGVSEAYESAIHEVLGGKALASYLNNGGLRNRGPSEVVRELRPLQTAGQIAQLSEQLVAAKLHHLVDQIGTPVGGSLWPVPCTDFLAFWRCLTESDIRTGVISSGHTAFIEQVFQLHGLPLPEVIVSDDDIRQRHSVSLQWRTKPGTLQFTLARRRLALDYGEGLQSASFHDKRGIIYFGDDAGKDGRLALAAGVRFGYFNPQCSKMESIAGGFQFASWKWVQDLLP